MPVITGSLSAVCSQVPHSESNDGISGQDRLDREGILLRELSLHVAKRRNQALHFVSGEKALSFRRWNRTDHVGAKARAIPTRGLMVWNVILRLAALAEITQLHFAYSQCDKLASSVSSDSIRQQ